MGAEVHQVVPLGYGTVVHAATACGHVEVLDVIFAHEKTDLQRLLSLTIDLPRLGKGITAFHLAAHYNATGPTETLLSAMEERLNTENIYQILGFMTSTGETAVEVAARRRNKQVLRLLEDFKLNWGTRLGGEELPLLHQLLDVPQRRNAQLIRAVLSSHSYTLCRVLSI